MVLSGFVGWGILAGGIAGVARGERPDWGLSAGWGMALVLAAGGVLSLAGAAVPGALFAMVLAGAAVHLVAVFKGPVPFRGLRGVAGLLIVLVALPLLARYAAMVSYQAMSCGDDEIAYFTFVSRLLQTGTLIEPFSIRRLAGYGGQTFLQSLVVAAGSENNAYLVDRGIGVIVSFGLVIGYFRRRRTFRPVHYAVGLLLTIVLPFPLMNSASHITGLVMFLTLFRTLNGVPGEGVPGDGVPRPAETSPRYLWLIGLVLAGASSLRAHFLVAASVTVAVYWLLCLLADRSRRARYLTSLGHVGLSALVFLAPWMALLQRSSGSVLYPLFHGNHRPEFEAYSAPLDFSEHLEFFSGFFSDTGVALFFAPLLVYAFRRGERAGLALYIGALVTAAAVVVKFTLSDVENIHRYIAPFLSAAFISSIIAVLGDFPRDARAKTEAKAEVGAGKRRPPFAGDLILWGMAVVFIPFFIAKDVNRLADHWGRAVIGPEARAAYGRMQSAIPEKERFLAIVDHPFALDYRRNPVLNVDVPGAVSPDPGMPFFKGPGPLKDYLLGQSIPYIVFRDFSMAGGCLYRRDMWEFYGGGANAMWRWLSKYYLDLMDNVEALAGSEKTIYRKGGLSVMRLR